jgi:hypothetical protein
VCNTVLDNGTVQMALYDNAAIQLGYSEETGLGWNMFAVSQPSAPLIDLVRGTMVYKAGTNECDLPGVGPFIRTTQRNKSLGYNYWSEANPQRFSPPYWFSPDPMYALPAPACGQSQQSPPMVGKEEIYASGISSLADSNDADALAYFAQLLAPDSLSGWEWSLFAQTQMMPVAEKIGANIAVDLQSNFATIADTVADSALRSIAVLNAAKALLGAGSTEEAIGSFIHIAEQAGSVVDSIAAVVDSALATMHDEPASGQSVGHIQGVSAQRINAQIAYEAWSSSMISRMQQSQPAVDAVIATLPTEYRLYPNFPNPFNPSTEIKFDLPAASRAKLQVFNTLGQLVATVLDESRVAGQHTVRWDAGRFASGLYIYRLEANGFVDAKKMVLEVQPKTLLSLSRF